MRTLTGLLVALTAWAMASPVALAHPRLDQAREAYESADLSAAETAIDAAFDVGNLSRDEYLEALVLRALIGNAGSRAVIRDDSLRQIAAIEPEYEFPAEAPPSLRRRFDSIREELAGEEVTAELALVRGEERFTGRLTLSDPVRVVVSTEVVCRAGDDVFQATGTDVFGLVPRYRAVTCVARLLGRGGTSLGRVEGALEAEGVDPSAPCIGPDCPDLGGDDGLAIGLGIAIPLALIAAGIAVLVYFLSLPPDDPVAPPPSTQFFVPTGFRM